MFLKCPWGPYLRLVNICGGLMRARNKYLVFGAWRSNYIAQYLWDIFNYLFAQDTCLWLKSPHITGQTVPFRWPDDVIQNDATRALNTLRPRQNGCRFTDEFWKYIFLNENAWISIIISLKFVPKDPNNNMSALFQIMAWRRPGDKPLSEPMMVSLLTHICVTQPQWISVSSDMGILWHGWPD